MDQALKSLMASEEEVLSRGLSCLLFLLSFAPLMRALSCFSAFFLPSASSAELLWLASTLGAACPVEARGWLHPRGRDGEGAALLSSP